MANSATRGALAVGIDIGGTNTKYGLVDRDGNVLFSDEVSTKNHEEIGSYLDELHRVVSMMIDQAGGIGQIKGIGVGAPNGNFYTGTIEYAPNLPWKGIIPLAKMIENRFHLPVTLTNDANAAAIGEMMYGAAKGMKDFIMSYRKHAFRQSKDCGHTVAKLAYHHLTVGIEPDKYEYQNTK